MKIAFHSNQLCERGTEIALYDYAHFNETILSNESVILANGTSKNNTVSAMEKFRKRFTVYLYSDFNEVDSILSNEGVDVLYAIKSGKIDNVVSNKVKTVVHCVFNPSEPHGDVYASISQRLNQRFGVAIPVVPHMAYLPDYTGNLREELGIPSNAVVFGRYGGLDMFDIGFVHETINYIVNNRENIYFLFMNTKPFYRSWLRRSHKHIIHLPSTVSLERKVQFINSCDAMLHARSGGETFGLAVAEFSIKNKPIITWGPGQNIIAGRYYDDAHLDMLGDKAIVYSNADELHNILMNFDTTIMSTKKWDMYSESYSPEVVMRNFENVFLGG